MRDHYQKGEWQMTIQNQSEQQLNNLEENYRRQNLTEGGKYNLHEIKLENLRRNSGDLRPLDVVSAICILSENSQDGLLTFLDIWRHFYPDKDWVWPPSFNVVTKALGGAIYHCVTHGLPILTVLVVPINTRILTDDAIQGIYDGCKKVGVDVGLIPKDFVESQVEISKEFARNSTQ